VRVVDQTIAWQVVSFVLQLRDRTMLLHESGRGKARGAQFAYPDFATRSMAYPIFTAIRSVVGAPLVNYA